jgi:dTDP-4-dehydrorhamnose reductase
MKILIIGARGMLGSMLQQVLADLDPTGWDRAELDIVDADAIRAKIGAEKPDVLINAAAYTDVDGAETNKELAVAVNADAVRNLARVAQELGTTVVHYSTDYVFPGTKAEGYAEDDAPGPAVNAYGESKLAGEKALQEIAPNFYLLRTAWLYGPNGKNFVDTIMRLGKERPELNVVNDQRGCPTFTKDVAQATRTLLEEKYPFGIYHTVNEGSTTWYEFTQEIFRLKGITTPLKPITSAEYPLPAKRPQYSRLLNTKGPKLRPWQEALADYLDEKQKI